MDKSSDSSSDSDSSSSTSWVFVDDTTTPSPKAANTFHLDCSREPIQELTEQDLLSAGSDFESDTDGISVISESEVPTDDPCLNVQTSSCSNDSVEVTDETTIDHKDDIVADHINTDETAAKVALLVKEENEKLTNIFKPLHLLGIGFVLTAVFLASYSYITKTNEENVDYKSVDDVPSYDKIKIDIIDVTTYKNLNKLRNAETELNEDLKEIVELTITCAFPYKRNNDLLDSQIKKCVEKEYKTKKIGSSNIPGIYDSEALKSGNNYFSGTKSKKKASSNIPGSYFNDNVKRKFNKNKNKEANCNKNDDAVCKVESEDHISYKQKKKEKVGDKAEKLPKRRIQETATNDRKKYNSQEKFNNDYKRSAPFESHERPSKNQIPAKKPYKHQKDKKQYHDYKEKKQYQDYKVKKDNYVDKKKYEVKHNFNKNFKHRKNIEVIVKYKDEDNKHKYKEIPSKNIKIKESKYKDKMTQHKQNNSTTGEWYTNLHKARNQIRKQEHVSDWVFDRAHIRSKKRNKAQWYFKWMNIREQLRYKQSYKPYSS